MSDDSARLTVEAVDREAGSGVARLSGPVRRRLGLLTGETVLVEGAETALATVWPAAEGLPTDAVALDATTRSRAGVEVGDVVRIEPASISSADAVVLAHPSPNAVTDREVRRALGGRPVTADDEATVAGETARVLSVRPGSVVHVTAETTISVRPPESTPAAQSDRRSLTFEDVGGLDEEIELVREVVELPLAEPERFERIGIEPPTGVLLHGPPGTGKTRLVEAVAGSVDATLYHVSGPEIVSKYKGESEARLRETFERARADAPSIVFFDEVDAIAGHRDEGGDMEGRVVAQLLSLMDGLAPRGRIVVVGATNRLDAVDPALRRPGRFDREIEIGVPGEAGRREILAIHTRGVPLGEDVDLDRLASRTHGFVGADLRALVTEAAMAALRRTRTAGDGPAASPEAPETADATGAAGAAGTADADRDGGTELTVSRADFEAAMAAVEPSAMREYVAEIPATSYDDVGGLAEAKRRLREAIEWPLAYPRLFEETGTEPPTGILLYGPPGTGKTLLARAAAHESGVNVIHVAGPELLDKYVGESERAIRAVFERARQTAPTVVFFDEIDAIAERRGDDEVGERMLSQLLAELDGLAENPNLVVLAATNRREVLDPALLRPGRLEVHVEVPEPDESARREILAVHAADVPLADDVDLDRLAADLSGATGADIAALVREATMRAIREFADEVGPAAANERAEEIVVRTEHVEEALDEGRPDPGR